jgi:hypothetical protein
MVVAQVVEIDLDHASRGRRPAELVRRRSDRSSVGSCSSSPSFMAHQRQCYVGGTAQLTTRDPDRRDDATCYAAVARTVRT